MARAPDSMTRQALLRRSAALGGALAFAPVLASTARAGESGGAAPRLAQTLFANESLNFETLFAVGSASYGAGEFGEIATVVNRINARGGTLDAVYDEWWAMGDRLRRSGQAALGKGRHVTARDSFLRAAQYYNQALFFVLGTNRPGREARVYAQMDECWSSACRLFTPACERVAVPYAGTTLPGWLLKPAGSATRRPTVILNNGSDGQNIDLYAYGGAAALERGYNALIFEGPGQGAMLFERKIPFRPDWEKVITPIVDFLRRRDDVDSKRIALTGWSMCGELVVRAAAFEHRLAAVVADPGLVHVITGWHFPAVLRRLVREGQRQAVNEGWAQVMHGANAWERFTVAKRSEIYRPRDAFDLIAKLEQFTNADVAHLVRAPTLVTDYELEQFSPGQPRQLYRLLRAPKKLVRMTAAEGAQYHDAPMAPRRRNEVVFDWLDETLGL
jgi:hypothetical protein